MAFPGYLYVPHGAALGGRAVVGGESFLGGKVDRKCQEDLLDAFRVRFGYVLVMFWIRFRCVLHLNVFFWVRLHYVFNIISFCF